MSKLMLISGAVVTTFAASDSMVPIYDIASGSSIPEQLHAPVPTEDLVARRLSIHAEQFEEALTSALEDLSSARDMIRDPILETVSALKDFSPSELLADRAREALQNLDEEPPRNLRERIARKSRDAAVEKVISTLEFVGMEKEDEVREFLADNAQEARDFASAEAEEWEEFFVENAAESTKFLEDNPAVAQLLEDPYLATTKEFWADNGDALREFLGENADDAGDFVMGQVTDAVEFLEQNAVQARGFIVDNLEFLTENVARILELAKLLGFQNDALDALEDFAAYPQEFLAAYAREFLDQKVDSLTDKAQEFVGQAVDSAQSALDTLGLDLDEVAFNLDFGGEEENAEIDGEIFDEPTEFLADIPLEEIAIDFGDLIQPNEPW